MKGPDCIMISFVLSLAVLIIGYLVWGKVVNEVFSPDERITPAISENDGVDCVPIKTWKAFLIQFLNIAGTGPIFGAIMGAVFGPVVFLWIVFGSVFAGAVHDYMCGMISCRNKGVSIAELMGIYLGSSAKWAMRVFTVILLLLCGTVFITSPAALLADLTPSFVSKNVWVIIILIYFVTATILPIDKLIAKIYPIFGLILLVMAVGIISGISLEGYTIPEITFSDLHPDNLPVWPFMFVTVACGAISGFHATQSPMVAKCITTEKDGRKVFYGAMICESVIALIWAAAGVAYYGATHELQSAISSLGQSGVVYEISTGLLGIFGGILAVVGVCICPITSGDTAFRAARLTIAECLKLDQKKIRNRLFIAIPLFVCAAILTQINFDVLWRYFSWSNQTLAMIALWMATAYLIRKAKNKAYSLITAIPASFMTAVSATYIVVAPEGFQAPVSIGYAVGAAAALLAFAGYMYNCFFFKKKP